MNSAPSVARGPDRGHKFEIPVKHWHVPVEYLSWVTGSTAMSPEDYLRRTFIEAAMMYQSASLERLTKRLNR
jgi:hypothetical protein